MTKPISREDVNEALDVTVWDLGNEVLYEFCRSHPHHRTADEIIAKIWLIGRSYSAAIERGNGKPRQAERFYVETVAPGLQNSGIDGWLRQLPQPKADAADQPEKTVAVHKKVVDLFYRLTGRQKRALAAKYLHFHRPDLFFLYDSRSRKAVLSTTPTAQSLAPLQVSVFDRECRNFVRRCLWLRQELLRTTNRHLRPRDLDKVLLFLEQKWPK